MNRIYSIFTASLLAITVINTVHASDKPNACPVDGCSITIMDAKLQDGELAITLEGNFTPDMSKNHLHIWWGEKFTVQQVTGDAESVHKVTQGDWHPTDIYPNYVTQSAVSTKVRDGSKTICVSASDKNHNILDIDAYHCLDVSNLF